MGLLLTYHRAGVAKLRRLEAGGEGGLCRDENTVTVPLLFFHFVGIIQRYEVRATRQTRTRTSRDASSYLPKKSSRFGNTVRLRIYPTPNLRVETSCQRITN
ncbi:hypothetical protein V6N13_068423 [Hibiscus sabdariffa]|uniref:Uncharacterized protein n=1 Tax=Hibiscus sabdariffa TaxID=183260 RepID=A0ABR2QMV7_9ROSI